MDDTTEKKKNTLESFLYMFRTTRYCAKECQTLKIDKVLDEQDNECLRICSINFLKSTSIHGKFINEAVEIDMAF